jgi:hypothetical protein
MKKETDVSLDIPEINFPDTIELDDDIDFSVADFSIVDEEEQTRIIKPKMAKSAIYNKADFQYARDLAAKMSGTQRTDYMHRSGQFHFWRLAGSTCDVSRHRPQNNLLFHVVAVGKQRGQLQKSAAFPQRGENQSDAVRLLL